jgi:cobaltochelatase CobN
MDIKQVTWRNNMKTRMIIFALLATLVMLPAALADYPMFGLDPPRTADAPGFAPVTDNLIWSTDVSSIGNGCIGCGASVADGCVYVSNWVSMAMDPTNLGLHCMHESNGSVIWNNSLSGWGGVSTPAVSDGRVFVGAYNGDLYCVNTSDGTTNWNTSVEPSPSYWGLASSPLIYDGMVYVVSFSDGTMHAVDFDGNELWNYSASGGSDMYMSVATDGSNLFFGGGNAMNCVDIVTHTEVWTFGGLGDKVTTTPAACDGVVYFATGKNEKKLYAVDIATGNKVWNRSLYGSLSSPAISDGKIYIGDKDKQINCIYASNGTTLWTQTIGGSCLSSPVVANGMVYTAANYDNGTIYGFDADDGTLAWSYDTGNWNMAQPSVSDGILFVGSDTGYLYAFSNMAWDGEVDLTSGTVNVTADKSAEAGGFNYSISDEWYETYGSLLFDMINDRPAEGWDGWNYWVNYPDDPMPMVGANCYELDDGDVVSWYWSSYSSGTGTNPGNSDMLIQTRVCVTELPNVVWNGSIDLTQVSRSGWLQLLDQ